MTLGLLRIINNVLNPVVDITNSAHYGKVQFPTIF